MPLRDCSIIPLETRSDDRGLLTVVEGGMHIPFDIKRIYYLHGVSTGTERGAHAHKALRQLMIAISGSFTVTLDDGTDRVTFTLDDPRRGLLICPMIWRTLNDFSPGAVCTVLASEHFDEGDYYRRYDDFMKALRP
jgi:hypothetical protein